MPNPRIGAHLAGGSKLLETGDLAVDLNLQVVQVFLHTPHRLTKLGPIDETDAEVQDSYRSRFASKFQTIVHGPYVLNLASDAKICDKYCVAYLLKLLTETANLGGTHLVLHIGSNTNGIEAGVQVVVRRMEMLIDCLITRKSIQRVVICLETDAGGGDHIGGIRVLKRIMEKVNHPNLAICIDTAHMFAAGVDWKIPGKIEQLAKYWNWIEIVHLNEPDKRVECGGHLDRHNSKFGEGALGEEVLHNIFKQMPNRLIILESRDKEVTEHNLGVVRGW